MQEILKILIGILFLVIGFFVGKYLASITKEELKDGQKYFKLIIFVSVIGALVSLILLNDILIFSFLFILIVSSGSLRLKH